MGDDGARIDGAALELFAAWLSRCEQGEPTEFEELLRAHPDLREQLVELEATRQRLAAAGEPPRSSLPDLGEAVSAADPSSSLIRELSAHDKHFGRYEIRGELGRGGMGAIFKIWDGELRRHLAMKVILGQADAPRDGTTPPVPGSRIARFLEEAQVTGQLDHPGIVPVHELGLDPQGRLYFTMKLVKGESLHAIFEHAREGRRDWSQTRALHVLLKVCEAMAYAHDKGVIHRDLKPANVMVGKFGEVHVMDWGLARIAGQRDRKDIRIREERPDAPLVTLDGDVVGTPAYMPPEQAAGKVDEVGPHSDVYALGAMLYHLLAGHPPYLPRGARLDNHAIWKRVQQGAPEPLGRIVPQTPAELLAICDKAMARDWKRRYRDMSELAADLSAYIDGRVVRAYETGAWAEARKWVSRNRSLAASLTAAVLLLVAGVVTSLMFARRASDQAAAAVRGKQDVLKLGAFRTLEELGQRADELWPARRERLPEYEQWIAAADALVARLPDLRATLAELESHALPQSPEEREQERASHPRANELEQKRLRLLWKQRMLGRASWPSEADVEAELAHEDLPQDAQKLFPLEKRWMNETDPPMGSQVRALLIARRALQAAASADERVQAHADIAEISFFLGRFDEVLPEADLAVELAGSRLRPVAEAFRSQLVDFMRAWRDESGQFTAAALQDADQLAREVAELETEVARRRVWRFPGNSAGGDDGDEYWRGQLQVLIDKLERFGDPERGPIRGLSPEFGLGIARRIELAATVERTCAGAEARRIWSAASEAISSAAAYDGVKWPGGAGLRPQLGLVPLGPDPESGLWEFADVQTGVAPVRDERGKLVVTEETGVVFVLLPGGKFWMGAQAEDPRKPNYDPDAQADEMPVHRVTLSPFLLSKFEWTQGQLLRVAGRNPSQFAPVGTTSRQLVDLRHPVENVTWLECVRWCERLGFILPSEAQWEYACRGGTNTPWWTGRELATLDGRVNLADQTAKDSGMKWYVPSVWPPLKDGWQLHAPVGSYAANAFGLHDMIGNVWEWCGDEMEVYDVADAVDPFQTRAGDGRDVAGRGGGYRDLPQTMRSARRDRGPAEKLDSDLGLRPARKLDP